MRLIPCLAALCLAAAPAAAQITVTHGFEGRFGVSYAEGTEPGGSRTRPLAGGSYTMNVRHPFDNGLTFGFSIGIAAGNFETRGDRAFRDFTPPSLPNPRTAPNL